MAETSNNQLTLALTTIGDLLCKQKITKNQDDKPIDGIALSIPIYQRPYKWGVRNVTQLLDDILNAMNENKEVYRVGTLILHRNGEKYDIVDGQQRTISFALMLKTLGIDCQFLQQNLKDNDFNRLNVAKNYDAFVRRFQDMQETTREHLKNYVTKQCEMIVVITDDLSEAFQFFDSQNARGKQLYPHDLLKAFHLREMTEVGKEETVKTVNTWENLDQKKLAKLFSEYLYCLKEWIHGDRAFKLNEQNIYKFKGVTKQDKSPYAQFYKSAYAYSEMLKNSAMPFVTGLENICGFQINAPIIAGKPFFEYAKHYFDILEDIRDNDKYRGYFINGNEIVATLDAFYKYRVGDLVARRLFDLAALLYVDRFCPEKPSKDDITLFEQFVVQDFIWAYSLRAQYKNLGFWSAQNYILKPDSDIINAMNIYKIIADADNPISLMSELSSKLQKLPSEKIIDKKDNLGEQKDGIEMNYLTFFKKYNYYVE